MNLNQLYYFRTLARTLNFHRASELLHIAQPTLSISMLNLEEELGVSLFLREGRHIELTKCGMQYLEGLDHILGDLDRLNGQMRRMSTRSQGHVDIGYISPLTKNFIPENVRAFLNEPGHEQVTFSFREDSTPALVEGLKSRVYDVVFCPQVEEEGDLQFIPILEQEIVAIVPLSHPLAHKGRIWLRELAGSAFVTYMPSSGIRGQIDSLLAHADWSPQTVCDASDEDGIASLVANGFGVSCVARVASLEHRKVSILELNDPNCTRSIYMAYLSRGQQPPAVQDFIRFIRERRLGTPDTRLTPSAAPPDR